MPSKIRYLISAPICTGAAARKAIVDGVALILKSDPTCTTPFVSGHDWRALCKNFLLLKALGHFPKHSVLRVLRERRHVRHNNSNYLQFMRQIFPKAQPGTWTFHQGTWYASSFAWAHKMIKGANFVCQSHPDGDGAWRWYSGPKGWPVEFVTIKDKKLLTAAQTAKLAKVPLQPSELTFKVPKSY